MKFIMLLSSLLCSSLLLGCVTPITLLHHDDKNTLMDETLGGPLSSPVDKINITANSFFWGLLKPKPQIDINGICSRTYSIKITRSFSQVLTSLITIGIYTPARIQITCDSHIENKTELNDFEEELNLE